MKQKKRKNYAPELIAIIQSLDVEALKQKCQAIRKQAQKAVSHQPKESRVVPCYLDDTVGDLGLTALHLVARAYKEHKEDAKLASIFDEMMAVLLQYGANPYLPVGATYRYERREGFTSIARKVINPGKSIFEVCQGVIPPSLFEAMQHSIEREGASFHRAILPDPFEFSSTTQSTENWASIRRHWAKRNKGVRNDFNKPYKGPTSIARALDEEVAYAYA